MLQRRQYNCVQANIVATVLFVAIIFSSQKNASSQCTPGSDETLWVQKKIYYCIPTSSECYHYYGNLVGYDKESSFIIGNNKFYFLNSSAHCNSTFSQRCEYIGGDKPPVHTYYYYGERVESNTIFTYHMSEYAYDCCPGNPNKEYPGQCGCDAPDTDSDNDTIADCIDECPNDSNKKQPGICGCGTVDAIFGGGDIVCSANNLENLGQCKN